LCRSDVALDGAGAWQMKLPTAEQEAAELSLREAVLPPKVQRLRQNLSSKAKEQKRSRFYSLYDKIIDKETLKAAYRQVRANDGAAGSPVLSEASAR
jgi:hypothetical protein